MHLIYDVYPIYAHYTCILTCAQCFHNNGKLVINYANTAAW